MANLEISPSPLKVEDDEARLKASRYPGRLLIMGLSTAGDKILQAYALTGRSDSSRNRIFTKGYIDSINVIAPDKTPAEMAATDGAELIYYRAMEKLRAAHIVSNGAQTDSIALSISKDQSLGRAVREAPTVETVKRPVDLSLYEPDELSTPRITGAVNLAQNAREPFGLAIVRKDSISDEPIYSTWRPEVGLSELTPGIGYGLQTYDGDFDNPQPYERPPFLFDLGEGTEDTAHRLWEHINSETIVGVVVKSIGLISLKGTESSQIGATAYTILNSRSRSVR